MSATSVSLKILEIWFPNVSLDTRKLVLDLLVKEDVFDLVDISFGFSSKTELLDLDDQNDPEVLEVLDALFERSPSAKKGWTQSACRKWARTPTPTVSSTSASSSCDFIVLLSSACKSCIFLRA